MGTQACPGCRAEVPVDPGWTPWCEACGWNVEPQAPPGATTLTGRWYAELGRRRGLALFEGLAAGAPLEAPNGIRPLILVISGLVVTAGGALWVAALALVVRGWPNPIAILAGVALACFAWASRPRFPPEVRDPVAWRDVPQLHALVGRVAGELGVPVPELLVFSGRMNASIGRAGGNRTVLELGLPLLVALRPGGRVGVLGHELAHLANRDPDRRILVHTALITLQTWHGLLSPAARPRRFAELIAWPLMVALSAIPWLATRALAHATYDDHQRAEYLADHLAARVAGTGDVLALFEGLLLGGAWGATWNATATSVRSEPIFPAFRALLARVPPRERERLRRIAELRETALDDTHPPLVWRCRLLRAHPMPARVVLSEAESAALDAELAPFEAALGRRLADLARWAR